MESLGTLYPPRRCRAARRRGSRAARGSGFPKARGALGALLGAFAALLGAFGALLGAFGALGGIWGASFGALLGAFGALGVILGANVGALGLARAPDCRWKALDPSFGEEGTAGRGGELRMALHLLWEALVDSHFGHPAAGIQEERPLREAEQWRQ